nr:MAG TPA: hypothetical protein [Caudoviricetes sp.]
MLAALMSGNLKKLAAIRSETWIWLIKWLV